MEFTPDGLAYALKDRRKAMGATQRELGLMIGVNRSTIMKWEAGKMSPAHCRLIDWLFGGDTQKNLWKKRAQIAEATLKDVNNALREYRSAQVRENVSGSDS